MADIGEKFRAAREARGVTTSKAALATRIKVQHIEAMEQNDFSGIAAPAYAKGFIKLYAEYLGLDPQPLVAEYLELHAPRKRMPLDTEASRKKTAKKKPDRTPEDRPRKEHARPSLVGRLRIPRVWLLRAAAGAAILLVLFLMLTAVGRLMRSCEDQRREREAAEQAVVIYEISGDEILAEPPEPYIHSEKRTLNTP